MILGEGVLGFSGTLRGKNRVGVLGFCGFFMV